jgi:hypothetical protein
MISHLPLKWNPPIQEVVSGNQLVVVHVIAAMMCVSVALYSAGTCDDMACTVVSHQYMLRHLRV